MEMSGKDCVQHHSTFNHSKNLQYVLFYFITFKCKMSILPHIYIIAEVNERDVKVNLNILYEASFVLQKIDGLNFGGKLGVAINNLAPLIPAIFP